MIIVPLSFRHELKTEYGFRNKTKRFAKYILLLAITITGFAIDRRQIISPGVMNMASELSNSCNAVLRSVAESILAQ